MNNIVVLFCVLSFGLNAQTFTYDDLNRIVSMKYSNEGSISFSYDKLGNRTGYTIVPAGCAKLVTNISNTDYGSLRHNIDCSISGDTIYFSSVLQDKEIELELPTIQVDKELYIIAPLSYNILLSNKDSSNTSVLMNISDDLYIEGLNVIGKTEESMILHIDTGGSLQFKSSHVEKLKIDSN